MASKQRDHLIPLWTSRWVKVGPNRKSPTKVNKYPHLKGTGRIKEDPPLPFQAYYTVRGFRAVKNVWASES